MLSFAMAALPFATSAQRTERIRRLGVLMSGSQTNQQSLRDVAGLLDGLKATGWLENKNLQLDYRWADGNADRARTFAAELASLAPDLIFSSGTVSLNALRAAGVGLPIVFANITDPVAGGFVTSLAHPGGNVTGFTPFEYDIGGKWLQLLKDAVPSVAHVSLLGDPVNHNFAGFVRSFSAAAKPMRVEPMAAPIRSVGDIERAIEAEARSPNGRLDRDSGHLLDRQQRPHRRVGEQVSIAGHLLEQCSCPARRPDVLWARFERASPCVGGLCGPDSERRQAGGPACAIAEQDELDDQPCDCQGARRHDPAVGAAAG